MPPVESKLSEDDRLRVATWIDNRLRQTACSAGDFAGAVAMRRLNRREYHNTIRDLLGVDYNVSELFPDDGTGGAGFDTNGETLYIPPLLMERYMEAAQQILDRAIVTPDLLKTFTASELLPRCEDGGPRASSTPARNSPRPSPSTSTATTIVRVAVERKDGMGTLALKVDGARASRCVLTVQQGRGARRTGAEATRPAAACVCAFGCGSRAACACCRSVAEGAPVPSPA